MRVAHLILAHKAPAQLERLLRALTHPQATSFIHLDKKTDPRPFAKLADLPNVHFTRVRLDVTWGGYSLMRAALESTREILAAPERYDFINLLSGQDFPIKPIASFHELLMQHPGRSFLEYQAGNSAWWRANQRRVSEYHLTEMPFPGRYTFQRVLNRLLPRRKPPLFSTLYGGNMGGWYTMHRTCAAYVLNFIDLHPQLRRFARFSWGSDEFLPHTILLNSPLAPTIINNSLRYIDWSGGGSNPKVLTSTNLPTLLASDRFFARKFDTQHDAEVLNQLDRLLAPALDQR